MKALVIGYGSIGRRHAEVLAGLGHDVAVVSRRNIDHPKHFKSIPSGVREFAPDYVVVASRTNEHRSDIAALADTKFAGMLLIEKPIYDQGSELPASTFSRTKVAFNLRFHPALQSFREIVSNTDVHAVTAYVGSYLPSWRPDSDYRTGYSADRTMGGGVLRDLSHELDYLTWIFGSWKRISAIGGHFSELEINSDDVFSILFATDHVPSLSLQLNYLDTTTRREVLALTDNGTVRLDLVAGTLETTDKTETFTVDRNDTYIAQHQAMVAGNNTYICDIAEGLEVMCMIDAAEKAAQTGAWINR